MTDEREQHPPSYGEWSREANQELIGWALHPTSSDTLMEIGNGLLGNFQPSFFAELDWQTYRPDQSDDDTRQIMCMINDYLFFYSIIHNIALRHPESPADAFTEDDLRRFVALHEAYLAHWLGPQGPALLEELDRYVESVRQPYWADLEAEILRYGRDRLATISTSPMVSARLTQVLDVLLANMIYLYLDLPWTRRKARAAIDRMLAVTAESPLLGSGKSYSADDAHRFSALLRDWAGIARGEGLADWAELADDAAVCAGALDVDTLAKYEGQWATGRTPCARCSMWFAFDTITSMDTTCSYVNWAQRGVVFIPAGIGTAECLYCGFVAPLDSPKMFYAEQRDQVVYLVPTKDMLGEEEAAEFWRATIEDLRVRYVEHLDDAARERFENAAELLTWNVRSFLYAIQMGEDIAEDHVYTFVALADGYGLIYDGSKRFARVLTPGEVDWYRSTGALELAQPEMERDVASALPGVDGPPLDVNSTDFVQRVLHRLTDINDWIDAKAAQTRRQSGEAGPVPSAGQSAQSGEAAQ
jgi:hypothetical protein